MKINIIIIIYQFKLSWLVGWLALEFHLVILEKYHNRIVVAKRTLAENLFLKMWMWPLEEEVSLYCEHRGAH